MNLNVKMKNFLRIAFLSLVLGIALSFKATVQAQVTAVDTVDVLPVPPKGMKGFTN